MKRKFNCVSPSCLDEMASRCDVAKKALAAIRSMEVTEFYNGKCEASVLVCKDPKTKEVLLMSGCTYCTVSESLVRCILDTGYCRNCSPEELIDCSREFFLLEVKNTANFKSFGLTKPTSLEVALAFQEVDAEHWEEMSVDLSEEISEFVMSLKDEE